MRAWLAALAALLFATPALADGLIDNVKGYTIGARGELVRFTGLLIDDRGRVAKLLEAWDKRPEKLDFKLDARGRVLLPGLVMPRGRLMLTGLSALVRESTDERAIERMTAALSAGGEGASPRERDSAIARGQELLLAQGVTSTIDIGTSAYDWHALRRAGDEGRLRVRVVSYAGGVDLLTAVAGTRPTGWLYDGRLRMIGAAIDAGGAPAEEARLRNLMSRAAMDNFQVAAVARDAAGNAQAIGAFEELALTYKGDRRWRLEGGVALAPEEATRLAAIEGLTSVLWDGLAALQPNADPVQTLSAITIGPARAAFADGRVGTLLAGHEADFLLVDGDPLGGGPPARIRETWVAGKRVWVFE